MNSNNNENKKKRNRKDNDEGGGREKEDKGKGNNGNTNNDYNNIDDIMASIILLEEEENQEEQNRVVDSEQHRAMFNANYDHQARLMNDYIDDVQTQHYQLDELVQTRSKKARLSAAAFAATAAGSVSEEPSSVQIESGSVQNKSNDVNTNQPHQRRLWVKDRSKDWWEMCNREDFPEEEFRRCFRMSKATFNMICDELDSVVTKKNTMLRDAIPVRQRVAVCIWRLATGDPLREVSKRFGLGISTCHKLVLEVCAAIKTVLLPKYLNWPEEETLKRTKQEFEGISGIPNVGGAIYTTHIPIIAPKISVASYFNKRQTERNQKTSYSITVQGVVNTKGVFNDLCIGWPGSMSDDEVLEKSALYQRGRGGCLKDVWIVGSSGYPLMDFVLVPYTHKNLTWTQHAFNEKVDDVQRIAKEAFVRVKGRWGCLQKRTEVKLDDLPAVLGACCALHNICEIMNEEMDPKLRFELFDDEMVAENGIRSANAMQKRDQIAHFLLHHGRTGTGFM